jgi:hypothetical protein
VQLHVPRRIARCNGRRAFAPPREATETEKSLSPFENHKDLAFLLPRHEACKEGLVPLAMKHPLQPHYGLQLAALQATEAQFLSLVSELQLLLPSLQSYLGGIESDSRQRGDCLRLLLTSIAPLAASAAIVEGGLIEVLHARGNTERRALALEACARMHHQLINGYRIARELAHRLGHQRHAARIDLLLARMSDSFPCSRTPEESRLVLVKIAG